MGGSITVKVKIIFVLAAAFILVVLVGVFIYTRPDYTFVVKPDLRYLVMDVSPDSAHFVTESVILSYTDNIGVILNSNGFTIFPEDIIKSTPDRNMLLGGQIEITRAPQINIIDGKRTKKVHSWAKTVADLLTEKGVPEIGKADEIDKQMGDPIVHDMTIIIVRVQETDISVTEVINYKTITKDDSSRYRGEADEVQQVGKNGQKVYTYHVRREDGEEVSRKLTKTDITVAVDKIILHPTKLKIGRVQNGNATWYKSKYQAASNTLKRGTNVRVSNPSNGKTIIIQIQDYMENDGSDGRRVIIDLHPDYFGQLGYTLGMGVVPIKVEEILN
jgi:rare lipoprotein A (peptidoglycan hydrolase)